MKKFMFSAIAMMAFSVGSMANTLESENKTLILSNVCDSIAHDTYHIWQGNGFEDEVARAKAKEAKDACEEELKKKKNTSIY